MPKRSTADWVIEALAFLLLIALFTSVAAKWEQLPDLVPQHFNAVGDPDRWGPKSGIWVLPAVGLGAYCLLTVLSNFAARFNVPFEVDRTAPEVLGLLRRSVAVMKTVMLLTLIYISWAAVNTALGNVHGLGPILLPVALSVIGVPGWFVVRLWRYRK